MLTKLNSISCVLCLLCVVILGTCVLYLLALTVGGRAALLHSILQPMQNLQCYPQLYYWYMMHLYTIVLYYNPEKADVCTPIYIQV